MTHRQFAARVVAFLVIPAATTSALTAWAALDLAAYAYRLIRNR